MNRKTVLLLCAGLFVIQYFIFKNNNPDYRSFIWFVLIANFFNALLFQSISFFYFISGLAGQPRWHALKVVPSLIPTFLFHFLATVFLSFFARSEVFSLMTADNKLKSEIPWPDIFSVFNNYLYLYFPYLLTKVSLLRMEKSSLHSSFALFRDALLLIVLSIAVPLLVLKLSTQFDLESNQANLFGISLFLFLPWSSLFTLDAQKAPLFQATTQFPVQVIETGPRGWGFFFMIFGLVFMSVGLGGFNINRNGGIIDIFFSIVFSLPFLIFGLGAFMLGINIQWGKKETRITPQTVSTRARILIPWPKTVQWELPLSDYQKPSKKIKRLKNKSNSNNQHTFEIELNLKTPMPKRGFELSRNVILYRSYYEDGFEEKLKAYQDLFKNI